MASGFSEAFAPIEIINQEIVMRDAWGHLAPESSEKYDGYIICAIGCTGDSIIFDYEFENLDGGPWLWEDVCDFTFNQDFPHRVPALYRFEGWYKDRQFGGGEFHKVKLNGDEHAI